MQSNLQSRKTVKLPTRLQRDLAGYALAAGTAGIAMLALSSAGDAQIIYTPARVRISNGEKLVVDFDGDGIVDLTVREGQCTQGSFFPAHSLQAVPDSTGGGIQMKYEPAAALESGAEIGPSKPFYTRQAFMAIDTHYGVYSWGSWAGGQINYLGIKFPINGETHYGWARLKVAFSFETKDIVALLTGYAYEMRPETAIRAGDTGENDAEGPQSPLSQPTAKLTQTLGALALGAQSLPHCGIY